MSTKEGKLLLIGFIALCQARSWENQAGHHRRPASVSASESALGSRPRVALSSAQPSRILKPFVALFTIEGVKQPCTERLYRGRF